MPKFTNLKDLEAYLQRNFHEVMNSSMELERVMAEEMSRAVVDVVYSAYDPKDYERRGNNDGLSDPRNGIVSDVIIEDNGKVRLIFENITEGNDSLQGDLLVDTIEEGIWDNWWSPASPYADARTFMQETANRIKQNPEDVIAAIEKGLSSKGFVVR